MPFEFTCEQCGTVFIRLSRVDRHGRGRFCSHSCAAHFRQPRRGLLPGPDGTMLVPLTKGAFAVIDEGDAELAASRSWYLHGDGYAASKSRAEGGALLHRLIMDAPDDVSVTVDHIDGDRLNNRRSNLRLATRGENAVNTGLRSTNSSGYRGVWRGEFAWLAIAGGEHLGSFPTADEAAHAYDRAARRKWGEFAQLNFPD